MDAVVGAELPPRPLFWEHWGRRAVYQDGWKLVTEGSGSSWELFNLADDPTEQKPRNQEFPERVEDLKALWQSWAEDYDVVPAPTKSRKK